MQTTTIANVEAHSVHLRALVHRESKVEYRRHHYLAPRWQGALWEWEAKARERTEMEVLRQSPTSVDALPQPLIPEGPAPSQRICAELRTATIEWMYRVVDKFRKSITQYYAL